MKKVVIAHAIGQCAENRGSKLPYTSVGSLRHHWQKRFHWFLSINLIDSRFYWHLILFDWNTSPNSEFVIVQTWDYFFQKVHTNVYIIMIVCRRDEWRQLQLKFALDLDESFDLVPFWMQHNHCQTHAWVLKRSNFTRFNVIPLFSAMQSSSNSLIKIWSRGVLAKYTTYFNLHFIMFT